MKKSPFFPFVFKKNKDTLSKALTPKVRSKTLPGPKSVQWAELLKRFECPQITYHGGTSPLFIRRGSGCNLYDADGNRFLDLTAAFAVASVGHSNPAVTRAVAEQSKILFHGLGDVHPSELKVELAKKLAEITPGGLGQTIFSSTGSEAVETALKTAVMHTRKTGVIAFTGAYHGLGYGALAVTHREDFKKPFMKQLGGFVSFAPFPDTRALGPKAVDLSLKAVTSLLAKSKRSKHPIGAVLLEPVQGRGGVVPAPAEFLKRLRALCDESKILLVADEVFTGFGRTGSWFAMERSGVVPDLLCLGKGMANGFPISACLGPARIMYSWGVSTGEAIHTSTFLGHPVGAAAALATIRQIEERKLVDHARTAGELFRKELWKLKEKYPAIADVRGAGLMIGLEFSDPPAAGSKSKAPVPAPARARAFAEGCLREGVLVLRSAPQGHVVSLTPPLVITAEDIALAVKTFDRALQKMPASG